MTAYRDRMLAGEYDANNPNRDTSGSTTSADLAGITGTPKRTPAKRTSTRTRTRRASK